MDYLSEEVTLVIISSIFLLFIASGIIILILAYQKKQQQYLREKEQLKTLFEKEILETRLEIQEQTLKNISQEIHDNIGQVLSLAKLNLATTDLSKPDSLSQKIEDSKSLIAKSIQDLRDLSKSLNTDYVKDMGLARSIEYQLEMIKKSGVFETNFEIEGAIYKFEPQTNLVLFRIVQEVLNNIIKHSKGTSIEIKLCYEAIKLSMNINDNGDGFDLNNLQENNRLGLGIRNMNNRAQLIGADFQISSIVKKGTSVKISIPFKT